MKQDDSHTDSTISKAFPLFPIDTEMIHNSVEIDTLIYTPLDTSNPIANSIAYYYGLKLQVIANKLCGATIHDDLYNTECHDIEALLACSDGRVMAVRSCDKFWDLWEFYIDDLGNAHVMRGNIAIILTKVGTVKEDIGEFIYYKSRVHTPDEMNLNIISILIV